MGEKTANKKKNQKEYLEQNLKKKKIIPMDI